MEELKEMEQEFIHFLVANGIDATDWEKMKETNPKEADTWVDAFSDTVLQKVLEEIKYLEMLSPTEARFIECGKEGMEMIALISQEVDLTSSEELKKAVDAPGKLEVFKGTKNYANNREEEIFGLTESGCNVSDGKMYLLLKQMV